MSNLELAFSALDVVRGKISLASSDNKRFFDPDPETLDKAGKERVMDRYIKHMNKLTLVKKVRAHHRNPQNFGASDLNVRNYGAFAFGVGAGNCLEMSCAAAWYLSKQGEHEHGLVHYGTAGDHVFVAIGQGAAADGTYPTDFSAWSNDAAVCDVWADIACPARDYPACWKARMGNWSIMKLQLGGKSASTWSDLVEKPKYRLE